MHRTLLLASAFFFSLVHSALAQVSCGDIITDSRVMAANLVCPAHSPAITINGGSLDMAGHTISNCLYDGVSIIGTKSQLKNGTIEGCGRGVLIGGTGKHVILNIVAKNNSDDGFVAVAAASGVRITNSSSINNDGFGFYLDDLGDKNQLKGLTASGSTYEGIVIGSNNNSLTDCVATGNDGGFEIFGGTNKVTRCKAIANRLEGFWIDAFGGHKFSQCVSANNEGEGFLIESDNNKFNRNTALGNDSVAFVVDGNGNTSIKDNATNNGGGFQFYGDGNTVSGSSATGNTEGFSVGGTRNTIKGCQAISNDGVGISISGPSGTATNNVSLSNQDDDIEGDCDETTFTSNVFGTSSDSCIE